MNKIKTHITENKIDYVGYLIAALMLIQMSSVDGYTFIGSWALAILIIGFVVCSPILLIIMFIVCLLDFKETYDWESFYISAFSLTLGVVALVTILS